MSNDGGEQRSRLSTREADVVRRLSGGFGWPTVLLALLLTTIDVGTAVLWATGVIPLALGLAANSVVAYAWYTVHHDATHKAISGRDPRWRWLEVACGNVAGFALQLDFASYARNHLRHHAHTNTPADPDLAVKGPLWRVPITWAVLMTMMFLAALPGGQLIVDHLVEHLTKKTGLVLPPQTDRDRADRRQLRRLSQIGLVLLVATIPFGAFWPAFLLWWFPSRLGILLLMVLFQWLPHFPFDRTDRFSATRVNRFPGSGWLLLQQDRHLIHHLYPAIPWYRYGVAFRELRPLLEANDAAIEGSGTSPHVPIRLRDGVGVPAPS